MTEHLKILSADCGHLKARTAALADWKENIVGSLAYQIPPTHIADAINEHGQPVTRMLDAARIDAKPLRLLRRTHDARLIGDVLDTIEELLGWVTRELATVTAEKASEPATAQPAPETGIDWTGLLLSPPLSAGEIATRLKEETPLVERCLRHFRQQYDYGFIADDDGEKKTYRYKIPDVLPHLQKWYVKHQKKKSMDN